MIIKGITATEVMNKAIDYTISHGKERTVWGGTIPESINDPNSPNDFHREMIEIDYPITLILRDPYKNWTDWSEHSTFITLRECEDHLQGYNPGHVIKYAPLYRRWVKNGYFNYTYGERLSYFPYRIDSVGARHNGIKSDFNQIKRAIELLKKHPTSRKICISSWSQTHDLGNDYVPCNVFFQIREVDDLLTWTTVVRSLDILRGASENLFMFPLWQQYVASKLDIDCGSYRTSVLNCHIYKDMVEKGYHKQNPPDPYNYYSGKNAFDEPFPGKEFKSIDKLLFNDKKGNNFQKIRSMCADLPVYWSNWKLALVGDWYRQHGLIELTVDCADHVTNEFVFPVLRYIKDIDVVEHLPSLEQREYLYETLTEMRT